MLDTPELYHWELDETVTGAVGRAEELRTLGHPAPWFQRNPQSISRLEQSHRARKAMTMQTDGKGRQEEERDQLDPGDVCFAWNSLVQSLEHGEFIMTALTDHRLLHKETLDMGHAVVIYGEICAQGESRIFQVRRGREHAATAEIVLKDGEWRVSQVVGPEFRPVDKEAKEAMEAAATAYNQAWTAPENPGHEYWKIDREGKEIPGTRGTGMAL